MTSNNQHTAKPDLCVFIGRFQPLHAGHTLVIKEGLARSRYMVVLVGSANEPRSFRNPFTAGERAQMIRDTFGNDPRLVVLPLEDSNYNLNDWLERAHRAVDAAWEHIRAENDTVPEKPTVALIGHAKDATSYYLKLFPRWASINVEQTHLLAATDVRTQLFGSLDMIRPELDAAFKHECAKAGVGDSMEDIIRRTSTMTTAVYLSRYIEFAKVGAREYLEAQRKSGAVDVSEPVISFMERFLGTEGYMNVAREYAFVAKYKYAWRFAPHTPIFVTADAVVIQSGHVLLVKRRSYPGKGLWALPGGFLEPDETIEQACLRELAEETALKVPDAVLKGHIKAREVFDAPYRSSRGRTVTHAHLIHLDPGPLPKIKTGGLAGDDETYKIDWVPLAKLRRELFFEDHYPIIIRMAGLI